MKPMLFTQLALAGIAAGYLSTAAFAEDNMALAEQEAAVTGPAAGDSASAPKAKADGNSCKGHGGCKGMGDKEAKATGHGCKGHNECKGMGGCKMSEKDLKAAAKKKGVPMDKVGKAHDCKGKNECKGLGGCKG